MKIFVPEILYVPSGCSTARVFIRRKSVPQPGSVRHIVPAHSPDTILGRMCSRIQSAPVIISAAYAAEVRPGYIAKDWLAESPISATAMVMRIGRPEPPNGTGAASPPQPASQYFL